MQRVSSGLSHKELFLISVVFKLLLPHYRRAIGHRACDGLGNNCGNLKIHCETAQPVKGWARTCF